MIWRIQDRTKQDENKIWAKIETLYTVTLPKHRDTKKGKGFGHIIQRCNSLHVRKKL